MIDINKNENVCTKVLSDSVFTIDEFNRPVLQIQSDQKLWESEHFMELYFAQCVAGIWFMEAEEPFAWDDTIDKEAALDYAFAHQHIVRVNDAMLQQYGASKEQFMGLTLNDFSGMTWKMQGKCGAVFLTMESSPAKPVKDGFLKTINLQEIWFGFWVITFAYIMQKAKWLVILDLNGILPPASWPKKP